MANFVNFLWISICYRLLSSIEPILILAHYVFLTKVSFDPRMIDIKNTILCSTISWYKRKRTREKWFNNNSAENPEKREKYLRPEERRIIRTRFISFSNISIRGFAIFHKKCIHRSKKIISIVEKGVYPWERFASWARYPVFVDLFRWILGKLDWAWRKAKETNRILNRIEARWTMPGLVVLRISCSSFFHAVRSDPPNWLLESHPSFCGYRFPPVATRNFFSSTTYSTNLLKS